MWRVRVCDARHPEIIIPHTGLGPSQTDGQPALQDTSFRSFQEPEEITNNVSNRREISKVVWLDALPRFTLREGVYLLWNYTRWRFRKQAEHLS